MINIVDVIGEYVELKKTGSNWVGLCPFHTEKTPSFTVNEGKKFFYCFGCKESGNAFSFLMKYKDINFVESVKEICSKYNIPLPENFKSARKKDEIDEKIFKVIHRAAFIYYYNLLKKDEGKDALKYLYDRGLTEESIIKFKLGLSFDGWDRLHNVLNAEKYSTDLMMKAGLVKKARTGNIIDWFRNRIMFPIFTEYNKIVGFGGRAFAEGDQPKYLNSSETNFFRKRELLYGLNHAQSEIKSKGFAILMEGYMDVIIASQFGITNAVASLGTGLTVEHIKRIERYTDRVILIFDGDKAGQNATKRGIINVLKTTVRSQVVILPEELDPADFLLERGKEEFEKLLENPTSALDFLIESNVGNYDIKSISEREKALSSVFRDLKYLGNSENVIDEALKRIAIRLSMNIKMIYSYYERFSGGQKFSRNELNEDKKFSVDKQESDLLFSILLNYKFINENYELISNYIFKDSYCKKVFDIFVEENKKVLQNNKYNNEELQPNFDKIIEQLEGKEKEFFTEEIMNDRKYKLNSSDFQKKLLRIKYSKMKEKSKDVLNEIAKLSKNEKENFEEIRSLLEEKNFLANELEKIRRTMNESPSVDRN